MEEAVKNKRPEGDEVSEGTNDEASRKEGVGHQISGLIGKEGGDGAGNEKLQQMEPLLGSINEKQSIPHEMAEGGLVNCSNGNRFCTIMEGEVNTISISRIFNCIKGSFLRETHPRRN